MPAVTFTGSTATGKRLLELSGRSNMKRLILEFGGKSPQVVFADAGDLDAVAEAVVGSITFNSGQVCVAGSRLLVERTVHDAVLERVVARAREIRAGDPLDESTTIGPLASLDQLARVRSYFESGMEEGGTLALDGSTGGPGRGCYWLPTVFTGVRPGMRVAQEEIFGPVLSTLAFDGEDEAVALANSTIYGLVATVWTRDLSRALRLAEPRFMEQFRRVLLSKLRMAFENASGDIELWHKWASNQIDSQLRERRRGIKRRRDGIERVQSAAGDLAQRIADLESQDARWQHLGTRLHTIAAALRDAAHASGGTRRRRAAAGADADAGRLAQRCRLR